MGGEGRRLRHLEFKAVGVVGRGLDVERLGAVEAEPLQEAGGRYVRAAVGVADLDRVLAMFVAVWISPPLCPHVSEATYAKELLETLLAETRLPRL